MFRQAVYFASMLDLTRCLETMARNEGEKWRGGKVRGGS